MCNVLLLFLLSINEFNTECRMNLKFTIVMFLSLIKFDECFNTIRWVVIAFLVLVLFLFHGFLTLFFDATFTAMLAFVCQYQYALFNCIEVVAPVV